jgi:type IV secretion system protein VirD4
MSQQNHSTAELAITTIKLPDMSAILEDPIFGLFGFSAVMAILMALTGGFASKKPKLSKGRFATKKEIKQAQKIADKQRVDGGLETSLMLGTIPLPFANESVAYAGAPGRGKTASVSNPALLDAIRRGLPVLCYDLKGGRSDSQTKIFAPIAADHGYEVYVFAPGQPYSDVMNLLDFVKSPTDIVTANKISEILEANTKGVNNTRKDFFTMSGVGIVAAGILTSKLSNYADLLMVSRIINIPELVDRLKEMRDDGGANPWVIGAWDQVLSSDGAEKQLAGMLATAQGIFKRFMAPELIPTFCGKSTIPKDFTGKKILFLQTDDDRRETVIPLLAVVIELLIAHNFREARKDSLVFLGDEIPSIYLPNLVKYVNELRSAGLIAFLGYQNFAQLKNQFGADLAEALVSACGTKVFFNPGSESTAKNFSAYLGNQDVHYHTSSKSYGKSHGRSRTEQIKEIPLISVNEFLTFGKGQCVMLNPGYQSKKGEKASLPLLTRMPLVKEDIALMKAGVKIWFSQMEKNLTNRAQRNLTITDIDLDVENRQIEAERLLPIQEK